MFGALVWFHVRQNVETVARQYAEALRENELAQQRIAEARRAGSIDGECIEVKRPALLEGPKP